VVSQALGLAHDDLLQSAQEHVFLSGLGVRCHLEHLRQEELRISDSNAC